jgi:hypothetical protein
MFKMMEIDKTLLFPVIRKKEELVTVEWFPPKCKEQQAFFGPVDKEKSEKFTPLPVRQNQPKDPTVNDILIDLGFNMVHSCFDNLVDTMKGAGRTFL